jgi:hypothetical protein
MQIKLVYATISIEISDEYNRSKIASLFDTGWEEISLSDYTTLRQAVDWYNRREYQSEQLILLRLPEPELTPKLLASEFLKWYREEQAKLVDKRSKYTQKKAEAKKKRDLAKLEKLKKQYETEK